GEARWDHQQEIRRAYGYRDLYAPGVRRELEEWLRARAWVAAERQGALVARAVERLIGQKVLLPGETVLARIVAGVRDEAARRAHSAVAAAAAPEHERLLALLQVSAGERESV